MVSDFRLENCVTCGEETELVFQGTDCLEKIIYVYACSFPCAEVAFSELECVYIFDEQGFA
jgi:azurin